MPPKGAPKRKAPVKKPIAKKVENDEAESVSNQNKYVPQINGSDEEQSENEVGHTSGQNSFKQQKGAHGQNMPKLYSDEENENTQENISHHSAKSSIFDTDQSESDAENEEQSKKLTKAIKPAKKVTKKANKGVKIANNSTAESENDENSTETELIKESKSKAAKSSKQSKATKSSGKKSDPVAKPVPEKKMVKKSSKVVQNDDKDKKVDGSKKTVKTTQKPLLKKGATKQMKESEKNKDNQASAKSKNVQTKKNLKEKKTDYVKKNNKSEKVLNGKSTPIQKVIANLFDTADANTSLHLNVRENTTIIQKIEAGVLLLAGTKKECTINHVREFLAKENLFDVERHDNKIKKLIRDMLDSKQIIPIRKQKKAKPSISVVFRLSAVKMKTLSRDKRKSIEMATKKRKQNELKTNIKPKPKPKPIADAQIEVKKDENNSQDENESDEFDDDEDVPPGLI